MTDQTSYKSEAMLALESLSNDSQSSDVSNQNISVDPNYHYYGLPIVFTLSTLLIIIMVMALIGNVLVIITILKNNDMRTRTNILLCNLALADILTATLDIPVSVYTLSVGKWPFSQAFCVFNGYLVGLGLMLSIHTLMWISIHKFISITRPMARSMTPGKIFCMILAAWAWALLFNLGPVLGWTQTVYKKGASQCGPKIPNTNLMRSHSVTNTMFNFIIPVAVMSYCYYKIFDEVREHMNRLQDFSDATIIMTIMQQRRIAKTLVIVFVCFIICWTPYIVYSTLLVTLGQEMVKPIFNPLAYLATYLNSACNPIIYALRSPSFRKGFEEILFGSTRIPEYSSRESFRWKRMNGIMVSFRRSVLRSKSTSDMSNRKSFRRRGPKYSVPSSDPLEKDQKFRRSNTLPAFKTERRVPKPANINNDQVCILSKQEAKSVQRLTSVSSITSLTMPICSPEDNSESEKSQFILDDKSSFLKIESIFSESPSPKNNKYLIYFPKTMSHHLSVSAPNLLLMTDDDDAYVNNSSNTVSETVSNLKIPEITYSRTCSEGDVQPFEVPTTSSQSNLNRKVVPKLVWQASIENLNVSNFPKRKKLKRHIDDESILTPQQLSRSFQHLSARRMTIPTVLSSFECLITNFFAPSSIQCSTSEICTVEKEKSSIFYTDEDPEKFDDNEPRILITRC